MATKRSEMAEGYAKGRATRSGIVCAAVRVFSQKGYRDTSVQDILDEVGITKGSFYHHWRSKEELALEILEQMGRAFKEEFDPRMRQATSGRERIETFLAVMTEISHRPDWHYSRLFLTFATGLREEDRCLFANIRQRIERFREMWVGMLREAQHEGSVRDDVPAESLAELVISALFGLHVVSGRTDISYVDLMATLRRILLGG